MARDRGLGAGSQRPGELGEHSEAALCCETCCSSVNQCSKMVVFSYSHLSNSTCNSKELLFKLDSGKLPIRGRSPAVCSHAGCLVQPASVAFLKTCCVDVMVHLKTFLGW